MTKQIRRGIFETNSSSTHSITISNLSNIVKPETTGEFVTLCGGEFGWEWARFNDWETKANYLAQSLAGSSWEHTGEIHGPKADLLREALSEVLGKPVVFDLNGYIDHQSYDVPDEALTSKETIKAFVFDKNSYLFTGNDNESAPPNHYDPMDVEYTHELSLVGVKCKKTYKFSGIPGREELIKGLENLWSNFTQENYRYSRNDKDEENDLANYHTETWGKDHRNGFDELDQNHMLVFLMRLNNKTNKYEVRNTKKIRFKLEEI